MAEGFGQDLYPYLSMMTNREKASFGAIGRKYAKWFQKISTLVVIVVQDVSKMKEHGIASGRVLGFDEERTKGQSSV